MAATCCGWRRGAQLRTGRARARSCSRSSRSRRIPSPGRRISRRPRCCRSAPQGPRPSARSQGRPTLAFRGDAGFVWVRSDSAPAGVGAAGPVRIRGPVLGGEGRLVFSQFAVGVGLLSGTLQNADQTVKRDLIEGRLLVAARPVPWLEMSVGPFVRAYVTDSSTERWVFWQARARVDAPIVTASLTSYVELWRGLSSQVNLVGGAGRVQGGEAGVVYRPPQRPYVLRLTYRVDDAVVRAVGSGSETLEAISLAVIVGGW